jgi:hypothetical protein
MALRDMVRRRMMVVAKGAKADIAFAALTGRGSQRAGSAAYFSSIGPFSKPPLCSRAPWAFFASSGDRRPAGATAAPLAQAAASSSKTQVRRRVDLFPGHLKEKLVARALGRQLRLQQFGTKLDDPQLQIANVGRVPVLLLGERCTDLAQLPAHRLGEWQQIVTPARRKLPLPPARRRSRPAVRPTMRDPRPSPRSNAIGVDGSGASIRAT